MDVRLFLVQLQLHLVDEWQFNWALSNVDDVSQARAKRFHHKEDAWRFLIGRHLRNYVIQTSPSFQQDPARGLHFSETATGKPYLLKPLLTPSLGFNISHDASVVVAATSLCDDTQLALEIGVDIMKICLPPQETITSLLDSLEGAMTTTERLFLRSSTSHLALRALYRLWTIKEAYVKAIGSGLGFDFTRIEYNFESCIVRVDQQSLTHWRIMTFDHSQEDGDYVGALAFRIPKEEASDCIAQLVDLQTLNYHSQSDDELLSASGM